MELSSNFKLKSKCELCKCLNLIAEGKKHPSQSVWVALLHKFNRIRERDSKAIASFCDAHRTPLTLNVDITSIASWVNEVNAILESQQRGKGREGN